MSEVVDLLDRPIYQYSEVDHIVGLPGGTARRWINGYRRSGVDYAPIIRVKHDVTEWVTWGEFVETRILAEYRDQRIPTLRLRGAVERLRELFDLRYPLAYLHPYLEAEQGDLLVRNTGFGDPDDETLTFLRTGQTLLDVRGRRVMTSAALARGRGGDLFAAELAPDTRFTGIVVNPARQGGRPTLMGRRVSVETVAGMAAAGEPHEALAADFGISLEQVQSAVDFAARAA